MSFTHIEIEGESILIPLLERDAQIYGVLVDNKGGDVSEIEQQNAQAKARAKRLDERAYSQIILFYPFHWENTFQSYVSVANADIIKEALEKGRKVSIICVVGDAVTFEFPLSDFAPTWDWGDVEMGEEDIRYFTAHWRDKDIEAPRPLPTPYARN